MMVVTKKLSGCTVEIQCDCGETRVANASNWVKKRYQSCGCIRSSNITQGKIRVDLTGQRFGRLVVIKLAERIKNQGSKWECLCDCGKVAIVWGHNLGRHANSCGCLSRESLIRYHTTHGQSKTKAYKLHRQRIREAARKQRVPQWADLEAIRVFYANCPEGMQVDHIIALQADFASGLHVLENLQYLPAFENLSKHNNFTPRFERKGENLSLFDVDVKYKT